MDAAGRQPAVRLGREPGRHDLGDPQAERAVLGEVAQLLQQRGVGHRRESRDGVDCDAALGGTAPAAEGRDGAAVGDRRKRGGVKVGAVHEPGYAAGYQDADLAGKSGAAGDDVVGSQRPDEILAAWRRVGDDGQAACPGEPRPASSPMPNVLDSSASSCATSRTTGSPSGTPLLMNAEITGSTRGEHPEPA